MTCTSCIGNHCLCCRVVFTEVLQTSKLFMRDVTVVRTYVCHYTAATYVPDHSHKIYSGTSVKGPSEKGNNLPTKDTILDPFPAYSKTSKKRPTSQQRTLF